MKNKEKLKVLIKYENGKAVCLCLKEHRRCGCDCETEIVLRDLYFGWKETFYQDKFGKSHLKK